jgi:hypothetical protein
MRVDQAQIIAFLRFWEEIPDRTRKGDAKKAWKDDLRRQVARLPAATVGPFTDIWRRRYEEQEASRGLVASRAGSLFVFVGIITTGAAIVGTSLASVHPVLLLLIVATGGCLLYSAVAAAFLAVRSQQVATWEVPRVDADATIDQRALDTTYAVEIVAAAEQNRSTLADRVSYLRDAQLWALIAVLLIAILAPLSVVAAITKSGPAVAGPSPSAGPVVTLPPAQATTSAGSAPSRTIASQRPVPATRSPAASH